MENINQIPNLQPIQVPEPVKNQNVFKYLFIVSIFVILGIIIAFYSLLNNKIEKLIEEKTTEVTTQTVPTTIPAKASVNTNPIFDQIYQQVKNENDVSKINGSYIGYTDSSDKFNYAIPTEQLFSVKLNIKDKIHEKIKKILSDKNFKLVSNNSLTGDLKENEIYQLDQTKCIIDIQENLYFGCFNDSQVSIAKQQQFMFLNAANSVMKNGLKFQALVYNIKIVGNEALGLYRGRAGGDHGDIYLYKDSSGFWKLIAVGGSDVLSCQEIKDNQVPINHWPDCVEVDSNFKETFKTGTFRIKNSSDDANIYKFSQE